MKTCTIQDMHGGPALEYQDDNNKDTEFLICIVKGTNSIVLTLEEADLLSCGIEKAVE